MSRTSKLVIHQTLHGYKDGHSPLASSLQLTAEDRRKMLFLSDLSGAKPVDGFDGYISTYFLDQSRFFVVSKTWFATEMNRPGCVWTHSLLISEEETLRLSSLRTLTNLFARPESGTDFTAYSKDLLVTELLDATEPPSFPLENLSEVLFSYYRAHHGKVAFSASSEKDFNESIISFWSLLWSRLRIETSFCTGYLGTGLREFDPFKVIVIPNRHRKYFERSDSGVTISQGITSSEYFGSISPSPSSTSKLSQITRDFGLELRSTIDILPQVIGLASLIESEDPDFWELGRVLEQILSEEITQSKLLERIFGPTTKRFSSLTRNFEARILEYLLFGAVPKLVNRFDAQLEPRLKSLSRDCPNETLSIVIHAIEQANGVDMELIREILLEINFRLTALPENLTSLTLAKLLTLNPELVSAVLRINHRIDLPDLIRRVMDEGTTKSQTQIFSSFIEAGMISDVARIAKETRNKSVIFLLLDMAEEHPSSEVIASVMDLVSGCPEIALQWAERHAATSSFLLEFLCKTISPATSNGKKLGEILASLNQRTPDLIENFPSDLALLFEVYILVCQLTQTNGLCDDESFARVYLALSSGRISSQSRQLLDRFIPQPRKAKFGSLESRMRLTAFDSFFKRKMSIQTFIRCFSASGDIVGIAETFQSFSVYSRWVFWDLLHRENPQTYSSLDRKFLQALQSRLTVGALL